MRGMRNISKAEHVEYAVRQMTNILRHRLRVTARINDKRGAICVIAQRFANAAAGRIQHQYRVGRFALGGGELSGIQRLEMKAGQSQLGSGLLLRRHCLRRAISIPG